MEFLKEVLGEELYGTVSLKVTEYNKEHKGSPLKLADLSKGENLLRCF